MKRKLTLVVGIGIGYLIGSPSGREQISAAVNKIWNNPQVRSRVSEAADTVKENAPDVADRVAGAARGAASTTAAKVRGEDARAEDATGTTAVNI